jgi:two-component system, response regulator PdtaR
MSEIKILIVEDDPIIAADIEAFLNNADYTVSGVAYSPGKAMQELKNNTPDLVLLDINLSAEINGIDIAMYIHESVKVPFIYLTSYSTSDIIKKAKLTEPSGYIIKPFDESDLYANIEIALYNYAQKQKFLHTHINLEASNRSLKEPLSERELDVLREIIDGKTNQQMAEKLYVSINTIKTHVSKIFQKFDVSSRTSLLAKLRGN